MSLKRKANKDFTKAGELIQGILDDCRSTDDLRMLKIWDVWEEAATSVIAEKAKPAAFRNGMLIVYTDNSAFLHQLHFLKKEIINRLNDSLNGGVVKDIRFKVGSL